MQVVFTNNKPGWAGAELEAAHNAAIPAIREIAKSYQGPDDDRKLVVLLHCPCGCASTYDEPLLREPNAVFVSPIEGLVHDFGTDESARRHGVAGRIHTPKLRPPYQGGQGDELMAPSLAAFLNDVHVTFDVALEQQPATA